MSGLRPVEKVALWLVPGLLWAALAGLPARAQVLLSGDWQTLMHEDQPERAQGPDLGDYLGIPINDAARLRAESWDASRLTLQEHQCRVHVAPYIYRGPLQVRIWEEKDPETQQAIQSNDIGADEHGRLYLIDRWGQGMHILEYTG